VVDDLSKISVPKSARKKAKRFLFSVDSAFDAVVAKIRKQHGSHCVSAMAGASEAACRRSLRCNRREKEREPPNDRRGANNSTILLSALALARARFESRPTTDAAPTT
jgi:hypothetical protein